MNTTKKITVCGTDKRYITVYKLFAEDGFDCRHIGTVTLHDVHKTDILILPIPAFDREGNLSCSDMTVYDLFGSLNSTTTIFAGKVPALMKKIANEFKMNLYDYTEVEEFNIFNAVATAEGAILTILERTHKTIWGSNFTVLGYGRIGRALALRLKYLGGKVTIGARSATARANASADSIEALPIEDAVKKSDNSVVINTIPAPIITESNIDHLKKSVIIDLASIPGGLTAEAKNILGDNFVHALALPGKYFPETAGTTIYKTIKNILNQTGVTL